MTRRGLLLPGRLYTTEQPLLAFTGLALEQHGWPVEKVSWQLPPHVTDVPAWVRAHAEDAMAAAPAEHWVIAAKSLGTHIVHAGRRADAYVLLTPLLVLPETVAAITALVADGAQVLLVGGSADQFWSTEGAAATGAEVVELPGADHVMVVPGDAVRTAVLHLEVTMAVDAFLAGLRQ